MSKGLRAVMMAVAIAAAAFSCKKPEQHIVPAGPDPGPAVNHPGPGEYDLPLIETTDMHGYIVTTDAGGVVHYRLAYIADKADDIRGHGSMRRKDRLLLLDGGDLYQGASVSNLLSGWPVYVAMDMMEYDAVALGNHEFDWGFESIVDEDATLPDYRWNGQDCVNEVPVLCANLYRDGERVSSTRDYVIVQKTAVGAGGSTVPVKIGIVGFAPDYSGSIMYSQFTGKGYSIKEDYAIANSIADDLETNYGCDATILLVHDEAKSAAERLGAGTPVDFVIGGHSHTISLSSTSWGLPYMQGGRYCEHYGYAVLRFTLDGDGNVSFKNVLKYSTPSVSSTADRHTRPGQNSEDLSDEILELSDVALEAIAQQQNEVIGYITEGATSAYISGSGERAATISNWMCDITRRIGEADVAFVNSGGIRTTFPLSQSRRAITAANVYEMFPFGNRVYVYSITYAELLRVFEYSMTSGGESLFSRMTGILCYYSRENHGSYYTGSVRSLRSGGTVIYQNGTWTGDWASRKVTLAVSEYLATTQRTDYYTGMPNPLIEWNSSERLLSSDMVDNENAVRVLRAEAAASGGQLHIDTSPHFMLY